MHFHTPKYPFILFLIGPTASGKTAHAIELVQKYSYEIISVDSSMVYRDMDIGTAKPTKEEQKAAPHRLINILDTVDSYSVAQFCNDAKREIEDILSHGKIPLLVGGTMLYFKALKDGLSELPASDISVRAKLQEQLIIDGLPKLYKRLKHIDKQSAERIRPNDRQRILRALELYEISGEPMSKLLDKSPPQPLPYKVVTKVLFSQDRDELHRRIAARFDQMLQRGFVDEVERLYRRGNLHLDLPSMRSVGYRQVWRYLDGELSYDEMREQAIIATRQLAKRQITWLRRFSTGENNVRNTRHRVSSSCCSSNFD